MEQIKLNFKKNLSIHVLGIIISLLLFVSCDESRIGQNPIDNMPPSTVTNVQAEAIPGGAKISYTLPKETDISYVICEYLFKNEKKIVRSSIYSNEIIVEGLGEIAPCEFTLYLVDHSENRSLPYNGSFVPLEPPHQTIFKTITIDPDFGGVVIRWTNETKALIGAFLFAMNDDGEWVERDLVFSSVENEKRSIRGYNTNERLFGISLVDRFGNTTDTLIMSAIPLYEKELDKKKFKDGHLLGDNFTSHNSRPISNIWDGNLSVIWHTVPDAGFTPPQTFTIDLGIKAKLSRFMLWNRSETYYYGQHNPRYFEVWATDVLSHDISDPYWRGTEWKNEWVMLGDFEVVKPSGLPLGQVTDEDRAVQDAGFEFIFESGVGEMRYVRFVVKETWARTAALHIREVSFFGDDGIRE